MLLHALLFDSLQVSSGVGLPAGQIQEEQVTLIRGLIAVVGTLFASVAARYLLSIAFATVAPSLSPQFLAAPSTLALAVAYLIGTLVVALAAGIVLGKLARDHLLVHLMAIGIASPTIGYATYGEAALPHRWQIVGYAVQLASIFLIARAMSHGRGHPPTSHAQAA